jgi:hypothetical protein
MDATLRTEALGMDAALSIEGAARAALRCSAVAKMETRERAVPPAALREALPVALREAGARVRREECTPA